MVNSNCSDSPVQFSAPPNSFQCYNWSYSFQLHCLSFCYLNLKNPPALGILKLNFVLDNKHDQKIFSKQRLNFYIYSLTSGFMSTLIF